MRRHTLKSDVRAALESPVVAWLASSMLCLLIIGLSAAVVLLASRLINP